MIPLTFSSFSISPFQHSPSSRALAVSRDWFIPVKYPPCRFSLSLFPCKMISICRCFTCQLQDRQVGLTWQSNNRFADEVRGYRRRFQSLAIRRDVYSVGGSSHDRSFRCLQLIPHQPNLRWLQLQRSSSNSVRSFRCVTFGQAVRPRDSFPSDEITTVDSLRLATRFRPRRVILPFFLILFISLTSFFFFFFLCSVS